MMTVNQRLTPLKRTLFAEDCEAFFVDQRLIRVHTGRSSALKHFLDELRRESGLLQESLNAETEKTAALKQQLFLTTQAASSAQKRAVTLEKEVVFAQAMSKGERNQNSAGKTKSEETEAYKWRFCGSYAQLLNALGSCSLRHLPLEPHSCLFAGALCGSSESDSNDKHRSAVWLLRE